ncbi:fimbria/pilus periplasmic chaperone [Alsobacter sp. KACC 23698]|uniref:Fimbria/pilus periplasmic chaperone n=1 Tax=Alsobacter sp. KACC 23698 TaxID=3149229 RepID=A0AAU7J8Z4_9HYPH
MSRITLAAAALCAASAVPAFAGALQVTPTLIETKGAAPVSVVTVRNEGSQPMNAQVRVLQWVQQNGREELIPASQVVASPPTVQLQPRQDYTVRLVTLGRAAAGPEEAYRVVISELPNPRDFKAGQVTILASHSIPMFRGGLGSPPKLSWRAQVQGGRVIVTATNAGGARAKILGLKVSDGRAVANFGEGLVGYVLADGTMSWERPVPKGFGSGPLRITARSDGGAIDAQVDSAR